MSVERVLKELEAALEKNYPSRLAGFDKPKKLDALAKVTGVKLPAEVIALYRWRGGASGFLVDKDTSASSDGWDWSSPDVVLADHKIWSKLKPKGWKQSWLSLFSNGGGDNVCLDVETGKLVGMFHEEPESHPVLFKDLLTALQFVLARVKAGKWCGVPESKGVQRLLAKLKKPEALDEGDFFGNDVARLMQTDPRGVLAVLEAAEAAKLRQTSILDARVDAYIELGELENVRTTFAAFLEASRKEGGFYNPPFHALANFYDQQKKKDWAAEVREIIAMKATYYLERSFTSDKDELRELLAGIEDSTRGRTAEEDIKSWTGMGLSEDEARKRTARNPSLAAAGDKLARLCVIKARTLEKLGKKADAAKAWEAAKKASPKIVAFWKGHVLLS